MTFIAGVWPFPRFLHVQRKARTHTGKKSLGEMLSEVIGPASPLELTSSDVHRQSLVVPEVPARQKLARKDFSRSMLNKKMSDWPLETC